MNNDKLTTIKLGGKLGKLFGRTHQFYISNPAEAIRALSTQVDGFREYLANPNRKTLYRVYVQDKQIDPEQELHEHTGTREVRISPVIQGAKRGGLFQVVLGAALIGLAFTPLGAAALPFELGALGAKVLIPMGMGLALGGVAQMLSPQPRLDKHDAAENKPNNNFSGTVNTVASGGHPVPVAYGRVICGSATVSAGIYTSDVN